MQRRVYIVALYFHGLRVSRQHKPAAKYKGMYSRGVGSLLVGIGGIGLQNIWLPGAPFDLGARAGLESSKGDQLTL